MKTKVIKILFYIWFFGTIFLLMFPVGKDHASSFLIVFGQMWLGFGLAPFILVPKEKKKEAFDINIISVLLGVILIIWGILINKKIQLEISTVIAIWGLLMIIAGIIMIIIAYKKKNNTNCTLKIKAKIIEVKTMKTYLNGHLVTHSCPVYEADYNNEKITLCNNEFNNKNIYHTGDIETIKINPKNPNEYINKSLNINSIILEGIGISFIIFGIVIFYLLNSTIKI